MNITETRSLLESISAIDKRLVDVDTLNAWHGIIGNVPFDIAQEALKLAQSDATIKYLEPRHIIGWAREAAFRLDRQKPKEEPKQYVKAPQPVCREHSKPILSCDPCCREISRQTNLNDNQLHLWAKQNIYA